MRSTAARLVVDMILLVILKAAIDVSQTLPGADFVILGKVPVAFIVRMVLVAVMLALLVQMYATAVSVVAHYLAMALQPGGSPGLGRSAEGAARMVVAAGYVVVFYALLRDIIAALVGFVPALGWVNGLFAAGMLVLELAILIAARDQLHRAAEALAPASAPSAASGAAGTNPAPAVGLVCPNCGAAVAAGMAVCAACGQRLQVIRS